MHFPVLECGFHTAAADADGQADKTEEEPCCDCHEQSPPQRDPQVAADEDSLEQGGLVVRWREMEVRAHDGVDEVRLNKG